MSTVAIMANWDGGVHRKDLRLLPVIISLLSSSLEMKRFLRFQCPVLWHNRKSVLFFEHAPNFLKTTCLVVDSSEYEEYNCTLKVATCKMRLFNSPFASRSGLTLELYV